jgi:glycosyltransferase involved in cell wall biosynthesis
MSRLRVLQAIPTLTVGGAERMMANLACHLRRRGHEVEVVSMYDPLGTWIERDLQAEGVPLHFLGKRPGIDLRMIPRIARIVASFRPDVVHSHMYVLKYALPAFAARPSCRFVHTVHTLAEQEAGWSSRVVNSVAFRTCVAPVAIGDAVARTVRRVYGIGPRRTIANGIPVGAYDAPPGAREAVRAELAIPADAPVFVTVAQFVAAKNHAGLIAAFGAESLRAVGAHLLLAGDGALRADAERQVDALGLRGRVHFLGVRSDVPRVLAAGDAFVLASRREGNPLSVMEAMAAGKPVVAPAVGCVPELVADGAGELVPPDDPRALVAAMVRLVEDPARARDEGLAAARRARERFGEDAMVAAYEQLYQELT